MMYVVTARVFTSFSVEAGSEAEAIQKATTLKQYSMTSPDGERVEVTEDDITQVEQAEQ